MSKELERLNREKQNIEEKIKKISSIANARPYSFKEIYDHDVIPFIATRACIYGAGETFENIIDNLDGSFPAHTKAGQVISNGVSYAIAGAAAAAVAICSIPMAVLESGYSIPVGAYQLASQSSKNMYNNRISKAQYKLNKLNTELGKVNDKIQNLEQNLEK